MRFAVLVKPGASRTFVGGRRGDSLIVSVSAPAVDGQANKAVRKALAEAFGVRARDVTIVRGERGRDKVVVVDPAPDNGDAVLAALLEA